MSGDGRTNGPPPVGEEIHLPGPSIQPALLTLGLTLLLLGIVDMRWMSILGLAILLVVLVRWIRDCAREMRELPSRSDH